MAYSFVAGTSAAPGSAGGSTAAINTTGADLIVAVVSSYVGSNEGSLTDSKGNTWTALTGRSAADNSRCRIYYCRGGTVGAGHTFSYSAALNTYPTIMVRAYSGSVATPGDGENGAAAAGNATSQATGTLTPSQDNDLLVTGCAFGASSSGETVDSSFTLGSGQNYGAGNNIGGAIADQVQTTATARNPTWSGSSCQRAVVVAAFKAAAGGGGGRLFRAGLDAAGLGAGGGPFFGSPLN